MAVSGGAAHRTVLGCVLVVLGMVTPLVSGLVSRRPGVDADVVAGLFLLVMWAAAIGTWACLAGGENAVVRFRIRPSPVDVVIAVLLGLGALALIPVLSLLAAQLLEPTALLDSTRRSPVWLIVAGVLTAAVTEEILYRAGAMELLLRAGWPRWSAVAVPLVVFVLCHLGSWSLAHTVGVVLPMGLLLGLVYLWRRNLLVTIVIHALIDAPLIVIAVVGSS